ncbi:hypothetical protein KDA_07310 [Dictyobacter alpinus]|uniref:Lipid/polyisoprenoid-binding YceI-like domain-containing protein n=1 Tax=Dictyobacter alpinus TaxID=2014873 RepID=A0A402B1S2_9CHLR|nr:YceI family protein [Dictyobacter alpinus]GCE25247.1 hypothetical protein KDA_07310 [Dictyobacter alpinus]
MKRRTALLIVVAIVVVIVAAGIAYSFYFAQQANAPREAPGVAVNCNPASSSTDLRSFEIVPDKTTASYKVHENLIIRNLPSTDAIGKTRDVHGTFRVSTKQAPQVATLHLTVNLSTLKTDEPRRDQYVRTQALETDTYPNAEFTSTCAAGLPVQYTDGQQVSFQLPGNLTMHGKTNQETFAVTGKVSGNTITGTASTSLFMTDFGIQPPNLANVAIAENKVVISIDLVAQQK